MPQRFVALMDSFNIPVVSLVDSVGMAIGCPCAQGKLARAAALLTSALSEATVGRVCVVTGNAIGAGYMALASRPAADVVYAWPGSVIAPLAAPAAVQVLMEEQLCGRRHRAGPDPSAAGRRAWHACGQARRPPAQEAREPAAVTAGPER